MATILPSQFSISPPSQSPYANTYSKLKIMKINGKSISLVSEPKLLKFDKRENGVFGFLCTCGASISSLSPKRWFSSGSSSSASDKSNENCELGSNLVDSFVSVLHESARSFSSAIERHESVRNGPELAKALIGVDVHAWHRHIAYQAAVYALLSTALEDDRRDDPSRVHKILSSKISLLLEFIEIQLNSRDPELVKWFKMVELPLLAGLSVPLFKRWSAKYGQSGIAVIVLSICCCVAVRKLGAGRISCPMFTLAIPTTIGELMDSSHSLVSMDRLHILASEAGFEQEFLSHYGAKVLPNRTSQELAFWIGLIQAKLSVAFHRENVISSLQDSQNRKDLEKELATLGLFAFLGRRTRLFFCRMGINDLDEQLRNFISFLECGGIYIYPELSSLPMYQLFVEVVAEEIGWLDFYASIPCINHPERRRSKQHAIQAEKEIILSAVFSVCSDVFSGFTHFINSTEQSPNVKMAAFLNQSQNLLNICLEDYWAAYYRSGELLKFAELVVPKPVVPLENQSTTSSRFLRNTINKLITTSSDILIGTRLLFLDISIALGFIMKQLCGHKLTEREKKKLRKTLVDFTSFIPVTILMLLPVSAVGHAAMLAAIKKYIPCLIPSSYSSERLDMVKQLNRTEKKKVQ